MRQKFQGRRSRSRRRIKSRKRKKKVLTDQLKWTNALSGTGTSELFGTVASFILFIVFSVRRAVKFSEVWQRCFLTRYFVGDFRVLIFLPMRAGLFIGRKF